METEIINLYLKGYGSPTISKKLNIPKRKILKILHEKKLIKKIINPLYSIFRFNKKNNKWFTFYNCKSCNNEIKVEASTKYYLSRNLKKKNICKKCSLEQQVGVGNPFYNKHHTPESKIKISNKKIGITPNQDFNTPSYRKKISELAKKRWAHPKSDNLKKKMSDILKKRIKNGELKSYNRSKAEDEIIEKLQKLNIDCEPNFIIESKIFDIYVPKFNLLIEYNGDYWHCNPKKYDANYWHKKKSKFAKEIWEYDAKKLYLSKEKGYTCKVIWEYDYKKDPNIINKIIKDYEKNN